MMSFFFKIPLPYHDFLQLNYSTRLYGAWEKYWERAIGGLPPVGSRSRAPGHRARYASSNLAIHRPIFDKF